MRAIFISYRRNDAEGEAGRLFDDLVREFGEQTVFMDVNTLEAGRDFRKAIDESVGSCGVLLSMIGTSWLSATNEAGERRLDDPSDFVRLETASALKRDIPVIPVLVRGAKMPVAGQLPDDLKDLAYRNAVELTHARWNSDIQLLIRALRPFVSTEANGRAAGPAGAGGASARVPGSRGQQSPEVNEVPPSKRGFITKVILGMAGLVVLVVAIRVMTSQSGVAVPDLAGSTPEGAGAKLQAAGLAVGTTLTASDSGKPPDTVTSQSPAAGMKVAKGTRVDFTVATASTPAQPPAGEQHSSAAASKPHPPDGEILIRNANSGLCLSPAGGVKDKNAEIVQFLCDRDPARLWRFVPVEGDMVQIRNIYSGMCLTVAGGNMSLNDHSVQYFCDEDRSRR